MINKSILIPTVTNSKKYLKGEVFLFSPSLKYNKQGKQSTINLVDCHTFYLRNFKRTDLNFCKLHYLYYIYYCKENIKKDNFIFILPDWDWIKDKSIVEELNNTFLINDLIGGNWLKTNSSLTNYNLNLNFIGYATQYQNINKIKDKWDWLHIFGLSGKGYKNNKFKLITYDSQNYSGYDFNKNRDAATFIQNLL